jgi:predicted enzyme related to lactoylglutathione lyase
MSNGRFVWQQLNTTDPAAAKQFYHDLLGWTYADNDMGGGMIYTQASANGVAFGGIMALMAPEGTPPHWIPYISTDNVDDGVKQIVSLGGQVLFGPDDIPGDIGRFALVADPQGALFNYFKPGMDGTVNETQPKPGEIAWRELLTSDPDAAAEFYQALFGWSARKEAMGADTYYLFQRGERNVGGMMQRPPQMPVSAWGVYFEVADIDAALARLKELGGTALAEIMTVPGTGRLVPALDPQGAAFSIMQQDPMPS